MKGFSIKFNHSGIVSEHDILNEVKQQIEEHNENGRQAIRDLIDLSIQSKTLITLVKDQHRGFGKTTLLAKKAEELGAVLIVPRTQVPSGYPYDSGIRSFQNADMVRGLKLRCNGFIVDEGVSTEVIKELVYNGNEFLGGFSRL